MKKELLALARTPAFALAGFMGILASAQYLLSYSPENDRSNGFSLWLMAGAFLLSASYLVIFCILKFIVKGPADSATKQEDSE